MVSDGVELLLIKVLYSTAERLTADKAKPRARKDMSNVFMMETGCTCLGLPGGTTTRLAVF